MICLSLTAPTLAANLELLRIHASRIDLAELRADLLDPGETGSVPGFPAQVAKMLGRDLPLICTARIAGDGGAWDRPESERLALLGAGISAGYDFVDLEMQLRESDEGRGLAELARRTGTTVIRSLHVLAGQPDNPAAVLRDLARVTGEVPKLAVMPGSTRALLDLLRAADSCDVSPRILIGMGEFGTATRILSRRFGSMLTYTSDPTTVQAAPGHIGPAALTDLYRHGSIDDRTHAFAVIGSPISHSRSPEYHNRRLAADGINAVYLPVLVDDVASFMELAELLPVSGFSVTIPHKESVLPFLSETDEGVRATGSCNTVLRSGETWRGINTDVPGFSRPLESALRRRRELRPGAERPVDSRGATVIGAGGAARAVVHALLQLGCRVHVINRSVDRAVSLAKTFPGSPVTAGPLERSNELADYRDIIVQTTSVGMHGSGDPVPWLEFCGEEIVYEIVYTPPETPLVKRAQEAGCTVLTGDLMFKSQADAQYRAFLSVLKG
jgi:3-dehydroquinate dehydratase/shikimate dehydrogenase